MLFFQPPTFSAADHHAAAAKGGTRWARARRRAGRRRPGGRPGAGPGPRGSRPGRHLGAGLRGGNFGIDREGGLFERLPDLLPSKICRTLSKIFQHFLNSDSGKLRENFDEKPSENNGFY